jgi:hypothetical protein
MTECAHRTYQVWPVVWEELKEKKVKTVTPEEVRGPHHPF